MTFSLKEIRSREQIGWSTIVMVCASEVGEVLERLVRQLFDLEDFPPSREIERFRDMGVLPKK